MPDDIAGPRKIRYFRDLLMIVVFLYVLGAVLDIAYGFTALETIMGFFAENPMVVFELAGFLSLMVLAAKAVRFVSENLD